MSVSEDEHQALKHLHSYLLCTNFPRQFALETTLQLPRVGYLALETLRQAIVPVARSVTLHTTIELDDWQNISLVDTSGEESEFCSTRPYS